MASETVLNLGIIFGGGRMRLIFARPGSLCFLRPLLERNGGCFLAPISR